MQSLHPGKGSGINRIITNQVREYSEGRLGIKSLASFVERVEKWASTR